VVAVVVVVIAPHPVQAVVVVVRQLLDGLQFHQVALSAQVAQVARLEPDLRVYQAQVAEFPVLGH
jgi:hypothetical protein